MTDLVGGSLHAMSHGQSHGHPRLIDKCEERRLVDLISSQRRATIAQTADKVNAGYNRMVSEHSA